MAKDEKETTAAIIAVNEMVLHELEQVMDRATNDLLRLVGQFVSLSSTGSLSVQVAVRVLKEAFMAMVTSAIDPDVLGKTREYLDCVTRKLELLNDATGDGQESVGNM
jgi:flagellar biosynthesis regulator FlaF